MNKKFRIMTIRKSPHSTKYRVESLFSRRVEGFFGIYSYIKHDWVFEQEYDSYQAALDRVDRMANYPKTVETVYFDTHGNRIVEDQS